MRKNTILGLIVALTLVGAACTKKTTTTNTNTVANTSVVTNTATTPGMTTGTFATNKNAGLDTNPVTAATLTITSSGISPKTLTITSGTTVAIINNDSRSHEIASNPHPDHTDLPELDKLVSAGSSTMFTFTKAGSWGYHDHNDPFNTAWQGTVIVQ